MKDKTKLEFIDEPIYIHGFPWRINSEKELLDEYERLKNKSKSPIVFPLHISSIGYKCSNAFFQYERMNTPGRGTRQTTIQYWYNNKEKIIKFSKKMNKDLFNSLNYYNYTPSQFPIINAIKLYIYFNATKVFDPYAGWGDRCLAAISLDIDYIGIDSNPNLEILYKKMIITYPSKSIVNIIINKCENINIDDFEFDFVLSSPPFWNKNNKLVERYFNTESDYQTFLFNSLIPVMNKCLKKNIWVCLYIPELMYKDISNIVGKAQKQLEFITAGKRIATIYCWRG